MPGTDGMWSQDTPNTDMEIFVGASEFKDIAGLASISSGNPGDLKLTLTTGQAGNLMADVTAAIKRTGVYGNPAIQQQQFGTAASLPGPTAVSGTSDPEGIRSYPPYKTSQLATLVGPVAGPVVKGIQINSVDTIFQLAAGSLTTAQLALSNTSFTDNTAAATVATLIAGGANNLPTASRANLYRFTLPVGTPAFTVISGSETLINLKFTPSGGSLVFYGCVLKCSFNFN